MDFALRPRTVDALLGVAVTGAVTWVISARQGGTQQPDAVAYAWAGGLGALMLVRRSWPRVVLVVSALGLFAYYAAGYPAVGVAVPLAAALFSAAEAGRAGVALVTAAGVLAVSVGFRLVEGDDAAYVVGFELVTHVTLMAVAIALGDAVRSRRTQKRQQRELARQEAEVRVREERLAVARDLHDSLGHSLAVISLHAEVAREASGSPATAEALREVRAAASGALRELRTTVTALRGGSPRSDVSLAGLTSLLDTARAAGFDVVARVEPGLGEVPRAVGEAAYRIVQEAVTNVVRHAEASRVEVSAVAGGGLLRITVADDGPPSHPAAGHGPDGAVRHGVDGAVRHGVDGGAGHGLAGLAERARALGGSVRTRHGPGGFVLEAELPLDPRGVR